MNKLNWSERWDEVLNTCGQDNYQLLLNVFKFIETDCYRFQSFSSFLKSELDAETEENLDAKGNN